MYPCQEDSLRYVAPKRNCVAPRHSVWHTTGHLRVAHDRAFGCMGNAPGAKRLSESLPHKIISTHIVDTIAMRAVIIQLLCFVAGLVAATLLRPLVPLPAPRTQPDDDLFSAIDTKFDMINSFTKIKHPTYTRGMWGIANKEEGGFFYGVSKTRFMFNHLRRLAAARPINTM